MWLPACFFFLSLVNHLGCRATFRVGLHPQLILYKHPHCPMLRCPSVCWILNLVTLTREMSENTLYWFEAHHCVEQLGNIMFSSFTKQMIWDLTQSYRKPRGCKSVENCPLGLIRSSTANATQGLICSDFHTMDACSPDIKIGTCMGMWGQESIDLTP